MKLGIIVVLALILSAFAAHFLLSDPGYVAINFHGYLVEMSVPVLVLLAVALVFSVWLIRKLILAPRRIGEAAGRYRAMRSGQKLTLGMIAVAEGDFARGEKMLARAASTSDSPLFNYLQAARAAHLQGRDDRRDEWLRLAYKETPEAANAVLLTQAEFQLDRGQHEQALATLRRLDENTKDHGRALILMGRLYYVLEDWRALGDLLPRIKKQGRTKSAAFDLWAIRVGRESLGRAADAEVLEAAWKSVSRAYKSDIALLVTYFEALMRVGSHEKAEKELAAALRSDWQGPLICLFGQVQGADASKQLKRAEGWLKDHGEDPDLLLAAARLCLRNELWGKARSYLESVISLRPSPEAYHEYGSLLNQIGEVSAAADAFADGLGMVAAKPLPAIAHMKSDL